MPYGWTTYEFRGEEDLKHFKCFVLAVGWAYPQFTPLFSYLWHTTIPYTQQYANEMLSTPTCLGFTDRIYKGHKYISTIVVPTEEEEKAREPTFRERMRPILDDPWGWYERQVEELKGYYDRFIPMDAKLKQMIDMEVLTYWQELTGNLWRRMWEIHMLLVHSLTLAGFDPFRSLWQQFIGSPASDPRFSKVLGGFDNSLFRLNKGLVELATKATELKVEDNFKLPDEDVIPAMEQSDAGRHWLKALHDFLGVHGLRMTRMIEICIPTWIEKPSLAIAEVKRMYAAGGVHAPDLERERLRREGDEIEREMLNKIPLEHRELFKKSLVVAQATNFMSEDHDYWCEFKTHSLIRHATMELGRRLVRGGAIDDPEDMFYLLPDQIVWGSILGERHDLHPVVSRNKKEYDGYMALGVPPNEEVPLFLGDPSYLPTLLAKNSQLEIIIGERVAIPEEVGATCVGAYGAAGVVEGTARVIMNEAEWDQLQPGEIMVCPMTSATWTPLFGVVKGVVVDSGGLLAHAAIVGREYGIAAVVGCMDATRKIRTGDRIRVDGNLLRVNVL